MVYVGFILLSVVCQTICTNPCSTEQTPHHLFFVNDTGQNYASQHLNITSKEICDVRLNKTALITNLTRNTIYRVNSEKSVIAFMGKEMFLALSDDYLGTEYVVPVYHDITWRSILGLGNPTNDDITVSLKFPEKRNFEGNLCPNETLDLTLQSYETESLTYSCDITGTRIVSSEKLIVYTASIPLSNSGGAEYLLEQLLPITLWGTHYVVVPLGDRPYGNVLTIVTAIDDTTIHISGYDFVTIPNKYDRIQRRVDLDTPLTIRSSQVVSVLQTFWFLSGERGSVNLIPIAFKTDLQKTFDDTDSLRYAYVSNIGYNGSEYVPLSNYFAYRNQSELLTAAQGCTVTSATPDQKGGTHCGFSKDNISDSVWPNKSHLTTEELKEIFSCFSGIGDISSENRDTFGTLFVLPNDDFNTSIFCLIGGYDSQHTFSGKKIIIKQHTKTGCEDVLRSIVNNSISLNATSPVIIFMNQRELSLSCQYKGVDSNYDTNVFIVPPVDILSTEYIVTFPPLPPDDADSECLILSLFDKTSYAIPQLNVSDTIQRMQQKRISSMATGMFIVANKVISVLCYIYDRNNQYIINHPLPSSGTYFQLMKSRNVIEEEFIMVSTEGNTALTFDMGTMEGLNYTLLHKRNALLQNMGENETYTWKENISILFITANKPVIVAVYFRQKETTSDSTPYCSNGTNFVYVPPASDVTWQNEENNNIYLFQNGWPYNFKISTREYLPTLNQLLPGDEEDNDQDGLVDEDNCLYFKDDYKAEVPSDLDLDGSDGEDCKGCPGGEGMNMFLTCEACDYGFYRERKSWKLRCQSCGENYTTFYQSSSSQNDCVPICTEGMQLNNDTSNNDTLYRENVVTGTLSSKSQTRVGGERKECEPCPVGYYKHTSAENISLSVSDRFWCIQCPVGKTTFTERNVQFTDCIDICEEGFELQNNNSCAECEIGFYKNISSANTTASFEERWNCTACRENLTTLNRGTVHEEGCIEHCLEGSFWNGSVCLPCPVGEYKNTSSKDLSLSYELRWNCTQCKDGKTTYRSGTNKDACLEHCLEGLYLADNGTCVLCDIGYFKNTSSKNVTLSENLRWNCTKCPDGKTTRTLGSRECVVTCDKGEEYNETTKSCDECKIGTYKNLTGSHIQCFVCPTNYTTRQPGKTSPNDCKKADCKCPCNRVHPVRNYTSAELAQVIHTIKKELEVNKAKLSSQLRKRISVMDNRPSARSLGAIGVAVISAVFIFLFVLDSIILFKQFPALVNTIKNCFARN